MVHLPVAFKTLIAKNQGVSFCKLSAFVTEMIHTTEEIAEMIHTTEE